MSNLYLPHRRSAFSASGVTAWNDLIAARSPYTWFKLDDSGETAVNSGSSEIDGTYVGSPSLQETALVTGSTYSADFDGTNDYVDGSGSVTTIPNGDSFTLEFWFDLDVFSHGKIFFIHKYSNGENMYFYQDEYADPDFRFSGLITNPNLFTFSSAESLSTGINHVFLMVDSSNPGENSFLVINGVLDGDGVQGNTNELSYSGGTWSLGSNDTASYINGNIDEFVFYDYELTVQDAYDSYASGTA